jgi:hypothetical protein
VLDQASTRAYAWAYHAGRSLARALRDRGSLQEAIGALPKSDDGALLAARVDGQDVVAQLSLANNAGGRATVWVRARARQAVALDIASSRGREAALFARLAELRAKPAADDTDPGAVRIGDDVRALFGGSEAEVDARGFKAPRTTDACPS